jgi:hypothetical protein
MSSFVTTVSPNTSAFYKTLREWLLIHKDNVKSDEAMFLWAHVPQRPRIHVTTLRFDDPLLMLAGGDPETRTPTTLFMHVNSVQLVVEIIRDATADDRKKAFIGFTE